MESILTSIKLLLGIQEEYTHFDNQIIMHINDAFMVLNQLGVGPSECFKIESDMEMWEDFLGKDTNFESVKTYIYRKVRVAFDTPTGSLLDAMNSQISEAEWRLTIQAENKAT